MIRNNQAKRLKEACNALIVLEHHMKLNHLFEAIKTQEQYKLGPNYAPVQKLEEMKTAFQNTVIETINTKAFSKAYNMLVPYMSISICKTNVAHVIRKLYIAQFENAFETCKTAINWEKSIELYTHFFDADSPLKGFLTEHELKVNEAILEPLPTIQESITYPQDLLVIEEM